jgi:hypothetical protein
MAKTYRHTVTVIEGRVGELARHVTHGGPFIRVRIVDGKDRAQNVYVEEGNAAGLSLGASVRLVMETE